MNKEEIIETLKLSYSRDVRKGLVKTILEQEKKDDEFATLEQYKLINQIFSYVLQQSGWRMGENSTNWDASPLTIMTEVFPKLSSTQWYKEQNLQTSGNVNIEIKE